MQANRLGGPTAESSNKAAGLVAAVDDALRECRRLNGRVLGSQNAEASSQLV